MLCLNSAGIFILVTHELSVNPTVTQKPCDCCPCMGNTRGALPLGTLWLGSLWSHRGCSLHPQASLVFALDFSAPVWQETLARSRRICRRTAVRHSGLYRGLFSRDSIWLRCSLCVYGVVIPLNLYAEFKLLSWGCVRTEACHLQHNLRSVCLYTEANPALCIKELSSVSWSCHSDIKDRMKYFLGKDLLCYSVTSWQFQEPRDCTLEWKSVRIFHTLRLFSFQCIHPKGPPSVSPSDCPRVFPASTRPQEHSSARAVTKEITQHNPAGSSQSQC